MMVIMIPIFDNDDVEDKNGDEEENMEAEKHPYKCLWYAVCSSVDHIQYFACLHDVNCTFLNHRPLEPAAQWVHTNLTLLWTEPKIERLTSNPYLGKTRHCPGNFPGNRRWWRHEPHDMMTSCQTAPLRTMARTWQESRWWNEPHRH